MSDESLREVILLFIYRMNIAIQRGSLVQNSGDAGFSG